MCRQFLKCGRFFFFTGKRYTFLGTIQGSKRFGPLQTIPRNASLYVLPKTKNKLTHFKNQRYIGVLMSLYMQYIPIYIYSQIYQSAGNYISKPPQSKITICYLYTKVPEVIFLNRLQNLSAGIILPPGNQVPVHLENLHESVKRIMQGKNIVNQGKFWLSK